jgi:hypothetical protein
MACLCVGGKFGDGRGHCDTLECFAYVGKGG